MASGLVRVTKDSKGVPIPQIAVLDTVDGIEVSIQRVIQEMPAKALFKGHGRLSPNVNVKDVPPTWTTAEAALCRMMLRWAEPWSIVQSGKSGVKVEPAPLISQVQNPAKAHKPAIKQRRVLTRLVYGPVGGVGNTIINAGAQIGYSAQECSQLEPASQQDVDVAQSSYNDAVQQLQVASAKLNAAQADFQQLNLQNPNLQQINVDLPAAGNALWKWQNDSNQALAAARDASRNALFCQNNTVLATAAGQAQSYADYFTNSNTLLQVAALNQGVQSLYQTIPAAIQKAQQDLSTQIQGLSIQLNSCMVLDTQWWGAQVVMNESCTMSFQQLLNLVATSGTTLGTVLALAGSAAGPVGALLRIIFFLISIEAGLVSQDITKADGGSGITINASWIPLGAGVLADLASYGTLSGEMYSLIEAAEQATLLGETTDPGFGSMWFSVFWITGN